MQCRGENYEAVRMFVNDDSLLGQIRIKDHTGKCGLGPLDLFSKVWL